MVEGVGAGGRRERSNSKSCCSFRDGEANGSRFGVPVVAESGRDEGCIVRG